MALSRDYRLITIIQPLTSDGTVISQQMLERHWRANEGRANLVLADLNPVGQWVVDRVTDLEGAGDPGEVDL